MRRSLLALGVLVGVPAFGSDPKSQFVDEMAKIILVASYSASLSHFFELECPRVGAERFTCTGQRTTIVSLSAGTCRIYTSPRDFHFTRTGPYKWTDFLAGEPYAEVYELKRLGTLEWELAFHEEKTREFKSDEERQLYSSERARILMAPYTARRITAAAFATMNCNRIEFVVTP